MTEPTDSERLYAASEKFPIAHVVAARLAINFIAALDWPEEDRTHLLSRLARQAKADVGKVYSAAVLRLAPLQNFDAVIPILGIHKKRAAGLVRALATVDLNAISPAGTQLQAALAREQLLRAQVNTLQSEIDRLYAQLQGNERPAHLAPMRLEEVAQSIAAQVHVADAQLRQANGFIRLGNVQLELQGRASTVDGDVALDFADLRAPSHLALAFAQNASTNEISANGPQPVPDVLGYTETMARRKLKSAGFDAIILRQGVDDVIVVRQVPAPGTVISLNTKIRLMIGQ